MRVHQYDRQSGCKFRPQILINQEPRSLREGFQKFDRLLSADIDRGARAFGRLKFHKVTSILRARFPCSRECGAHRIRSIPPYCAASPAGRRESLARSRNRHFLPLLKRKSETNSKTLFRSICNDPMARAEGNMKRIANSPSAPPVFSL